MKRFFLPLFSTPAVRRMLALFVFAGTFHPGLHMARGEPAPGDMKDKAAVGLDALELVKVVEAHFRLEMKTYDMPAIVKKPSDITVQINTKDMRNRTQFIPVWEDIPGTKRTVKAFKKIEAPDKDDPKVLKDVSEATILDKRTGAEVKLPLKQVVDFPETYAFFRYRWVKPGGDAAPEFRLQAGDTLVLPPELEKKYKVIEIKGDGVVIELPDKTRKTLTVPK